MARQRSFFATINAIAKETARIQRQAEKERQRQALEVEREYQQRARELVHQRKESERLTKEAERAAQQAARTADRTAKEIEKTAKQAAKQAKDKYLAELAQSVIDQNTQLIELVKELSLVLEHTLNINDTISFDSLRPSLNIPTLTLPDNLLKPALEPQKDHYLAQVKKPTGIGNFIGTTRNTYKKALQDAEAHYEADHRAYEATEAVRKAELARIQKDYAEKRQAILDEVQRKNQEIDEFTLAYKAGDPQAIIAYNGMVLERSEYPEDFPQEFRLAYVPESKELVIEYELPGSNLVPSVAEYKFVKSKESVEETPRKLSEIKELYQDIIAAVALRTIHEVLEADQNGHLLLIAFNGFVATIDPATGRDMRPCLISLRVSRERFLELNLARIDKRACLRNLGAQVSPRPAEMQAVKPIIEFDMVDKRYVEQSDVLSDLESRPNLMELTPFEFENLVGNLFGRMGLDTKVTRSSRDGGVDCVAYDVRPVLGGKVVIQAKRYSNTVGVSAVRDLYGTMMNEGANKGILVATSSYGPDAYDFAKDKPIELIDGGGLLYLLEQNGVKARIIFSNGG